MNGALLFKIPKKFCKENKNQRVFKTQLLFFNRGKPDFE